MDNLEFLLQREGDNTWLPLESPDVEILEGRYRIVSRSSRGEQEVEIRIVYDALDEVPPVRRVQTRRDRVNAEGLMVVIPYTHLKPGIWELSCSPDLQEGLLGKTWRATLQLRVLAGDVDGGDGLEPGTEDDRPDAVAEEPGETSPEPPPASEEPPPPEPELDATDVPVTLVLDRDSYLAELGKAFLLSGQVGVGDRPAEVGGPPSPPPQLLVCEPQLRICLRDPQTSEVLCECRQPIPQSILPVSFSTAIYVPFECQTRLVLGEIIFSGDTIPEVSQTFTVVMPVEQLLEAIADDFGEDDYQAGPLAVESLMESAGGLQLPLEGADAERLLSDPSPTLNPPSRERDADKTSPPELPTFGRPPAGEAAEPQAETEPPPGDEPSDREADTPGAEAETSPEADSEEIDTFSPLPEPSPESAIAPISPVDRSFSGLNLEERFWSRLSSLAKDRDLSQWMKRASSGPSPETPFAEAGESPESDTGGERPPVPDELRPLIAELEAEEIVVDDDFDEPAGFAARRLMGGPPGGGDRIQTPHVLPEDREVPAPLLEVRGEPVAGRPLPVRVQLPDDLPRIYVKIWVYDRQSRNIVDGPRWITEFSPNGFDRIETTLQLEIPYGSLEVQVEAIAVEMQTQRESHKAIVERTVSPTASPTLPLNEPPS
ncbi:MAG: hypothetical protein ACP5D7_16375 [Limnospira sp.]